MILYILLVCKVIQRHVPVVMYMCMFSGYAIVICIFRI